MIQGKAVWSAILIGLAVTAVQAEQFTSFDLISGDAVSAKVVFSGNYPILLEVVLGQRKARELENVTKTGVDQKIVITVNGEVIAEPTVRETVSDGILRLPADDEATAVRLAKSLTAQHKDSEPDTRKEDPKPAP